MWRILRAFWLNLKRLVLQYLPKPYLKTMQIHVISRQMPTGHEVLGAYASASEAEASAASHINQIVTQQNAQRDALFGAGEAFGALTTEAQTSPQISITVMTVGA